MSWNKPSSAPQQPPKKSAPPSLKRGLLAGLLVVALGALCYFMFRPSAATPQRDSAKNRGLIKEATPAAALKSVATQVVEKVKVEPPITTSKWGTLVSCKTNNTFGRVCLEYRDEAGKLHKVYRSTRPSLFKHGTDTLLLHALYRDDRHSMPPMPMSPNLDKSFLASLKDPIEILPDDPEDVVAKKQTVIEGRQRMKELMDGGATFSEVLADARKLFNENVKIRSKAQGELNRIVDSGDTEGTRQYLLKVNLALQQMGIRELDEPKHDERPNGDQKSNEN